MIYLRNCRLDSACKLLLGTGKASASVTEAALSSGFIHMSRFARYYRRRFGELPSDTKKIRFLVH